MEAESLCACKRASGNALSGAEPTARAKRTEKSVALKDSIAAALCAQAILRHPLTGHSLVVKYDPASACWCRQLRSSSSGAVGLAQQRCYMLLSCVGPEMMLQATASEMCPRQQQLTPRG